MFVEGEDGPVCGMLPGTPEDVEDKGLTTWLGEHNSILSTCEETWLLLVSQAVL